MKLVMLLTDNVS